MAAKVQEGLEALFSSLNTLSLASRDPHGGAILGRKAIGDEKDTRVTSKLGAWGAFCSIRPSKLDQGIDPPDVFSRVAFRPQAFQRFRSAEPLPWDFSHFRKPWISGPS